MPRRSEAVRTYSEPCQSYGCRGKLSFTVSRFQCGVTRRVQCSLCSSVFLVDVPLWWWKGSDWLEFYGNCLR